MNLYPISSHNQLFHENLQQELFPYPCKVYLKFHKKTISSFVREPYMGIVISLSLYIRFLAM
jgi:hypothetical protein